MGRIKMGPKLFISIFLCLFGSSLTLDGNEFCTTDKKFAGYNHLFFPNLDKFTTRPKCDPVVHFGLEMTQDGRNQRQGQCFKISRKWFAIQIIPIGFSAIFNTKIDIKSVECKDRNGEVTNKAIAHKKRELHEPGEICVSVSRQFRGAQKYQVMILAPKLPEDPTRPQFYQSPRFLCEYNNSNKRKPNKSHCKLEDEKDIDLCDLWVPEKK